MTKKTKSGKRQRYSTQFKDEAIALSEQMGVPEAANELGLKDSQLYSWRRARKLQQETSQADRDKDAEIARLKRKLAIKEEELAIIKKAAAYFAKEELK